ncbi:MAG: cytochrome c [Nitrococcus sp.]|nr:cytochrome c [Nitrococcus sp.]
MLNAPSRRRAQFKQVLLVLAAVGLGVSITDAWAADAAAGGTLFKQKCAACHTIGGGDTVGPDLAGVTERRDTAWLKSWIADPPGMIASGDPTATQLKSKYGMPMPDLGLSEDEIANVIAYLASGGAGGGQASAAGAAEAGSTAAAAESESTGSAEQGERLFTGEADFRNGGPACSACHAVADAGGGSLGPDLTTTYSRLGDAMITWPQAMLPMQPIFTEDPLTDTEKADLLAFFKEKAAGDDLSASGPVAMLLGLSIIGAIVLAVILSVVWKKRLIAVREPMVSGTNRWRR